MRLTAAALLVLLLSVAAAAVAETEETVDGDAASSEEGQGGADDAPDFANMPGFGGKPCPAFRCRSSGTAPVQVSRPKFVSRGGCAKMGGGMMMMAGGAGKGDEKYESCCHAWHACYQTCGASKKSCDDGFKQCSTKVCAGDEECKRSADLNSMMLGMGGCDLYDQGQRSGCECVKEKKVEKKRAAAIRAFYKKYAPENAENADRLAKKADSNAKMARLFRKLVSNYPQSIRLAKDERQRQMEEMLKRATEGTPETDDDSEKPRVKKAAVDDEDGDDGDEDEHINLDEL